MAASWSLQLSRAVGPSGSHRAPCVVHEALAQNGSFPGAALEESDSEEEEEKEEEGTDLGIMAELVSAFPEHWWPHQPGWWLRLLLVSPLTKALGPALPWLLGQEVPGAGTDPAACVTVSLQCPDVGKEEKYPTWKRTLMRQAREAQMKRFCKAQVSPTGESHISSLALSPVPSIPLPVAMCRQVVAHG